METRIHGTVRPEDINGSSFSVLAPGFKGRFVSVRPGAAATRAKKQPGEIPLASAASLSSVSVIVSGVIELEPPSSASGASTRSRAKVAPKLIVKARSGQGYALLHTHEFGRKRWLFPDKATSGSAALTAIFTLPSESAPVVTGAKVKKNTTRGLVTMTMRRVVSIITWASSPLVKATAQKIASAWEAERRPYGL